MPRLIRIFTFAALAMLVLAMPSSSLARKGHAKKHKVAHKADRNHDGLPDRWEKAHKLSLKVNQARRDQDRDGANNAAEFTSHTDPRDPDSDDDGIKDGNETVGTIASFTDGTLVITTAAGPVSGKVTDRTEIKIVPPAPVAMAADRGDSESSGPAGPTGPIGHDDEGDDDNRGASGASGATGPMGHDDGDDDEGDDDHGDRRGCPPVGATGATGPTGPTGPTGATGTTGPMGHDDGRHHGCRHGDTRGSKADLVPGAVVREAELKLTPTGPVWDELKIVGTMAAAPVAAPAPVRTATS